MWEKEHFLNEIVEIKSNKTRVILGVNAIERINDILKNNRFDNAIIVTNKKEYVKSEGWSNLERALKKNNVNYEVYNKVSFYSTTKEVDEAATLARTIQANVVIGFGDSCVVDVAKSLSIMYFYPEYSTRELFLSEFKPQKAIPNISINTSNGVGREINRYAYLTLPKENCKVGIEHELIYPLISINDPKLMTELTKEKTIYYSINAISHAIEASTSRIQNPYSAMLAKEVIYLINKYLPHVLKDDKNIASRYYLSYASIILGICLEHSTLHLTYALENSLYSLNTSAPYELGIAALMPYVIKNIFNERSKILADILSPILTKVEVAEEASEGIKKWLSSLGINESLGTLGFNEEDIPKLVDLTYKSPGIPAILYYSPVPVTWEFIEKIYREAM